VGAPTRPIPNTNGPCDFCRSDVWARLAPVPSDTDPTHSILSGLTAKWSFYRNGQLVPKGTFAKVFVPEQADYRFVQELSRPQDYPGVTLSSNVRTEWNVSSAAPTTMAVADCDKFLPKPTVCEALPAVMIGYDIRLSPLNQARAGLPFTFTVDGGRAKGWSGSSAMAGAKVSVSYDDGATWQPTKMARKDEKLLPGAGRASEPGRHKRVRDAADRDLGQRGNRTVQTITRAYTLS
jgi:hypothetical protein